MVKKNYIQILEEPSLIKQQNITELKAIVEEYPYFQSVRALYLKGLKNQDSFKYNNELKITAAYTTDRTVLFTFITSDIFQKKEKSLSKENIHQQIIDTTPQKLPQKTKKVQEIKEELSIGKPLVFTQNETHSFNQWLQLSVKKPINRNTKQAKPNIKNSIIDRFIQNNPKISRIEKGISSEIKINENTPPNQLMTETLAKVYLEQKKYENAIKAYTILGLKYPEKSSFFANQIKRIQILQNTK